MISSTAHAPLPVLIVTGMSGAGKTHALKMLEDCGYEAVDNIPLAFLPALVVRPKGPMTALAVGADIRGFDFSAEELLRHIQRLRRNNAQVRLFFLDCDDETLGRRFSETRRKHPLATDRPVADGIARERELLSPLKDAADVRIDTSDLTLPDLRRLIQGHFSIPAQGLTISLTSFSFARGLPREADIVLDVRFLKNPHYIPHLKQLTGLDAAVGTHIEEDEGFADFFTRTCAWLTPLLPRYRDEGKNYLTVAVGCTGGQHRSVYIAEKLASVLRGLEYNVTIRHRELS